ncbi:hypothetical protein BJX68DRAFT_52304 [Aspergillus pseudodeflectus]|uniref:Uncharacterized protein n=1 Tax=Aspergillus pseudodeflectus TaxID=176178 RepID=A0ABR4KM77_9EURO
MVRLTALLEGWQKHRSAAEAALKKTLFIDYHYPSYPSSASDLPTTLVKLTLKPFPSCLHYLSIISPFPLLPFSVVPALTSPLLLSLCLPFIPPSASNNTTSTGTILRPRPFQPLVTFSTSLPSRSSTRATSVDSSPDRSSSSSPPSFSLFSLVAFFFLRLALSLAHHDALGPRFVF